MGEGEGRQEIEGQIKPQRRGDGYLNLLRGRLFL